MNKSIYILLFATLGLTENSTHAAEICPSFVDSPTQKIVFPDGWELIPPASTKLYLQGVSFSAGHPGDGGIIKYDKTEKDGENTKYYYSHLNGKGQGDFWISCSYLGTNFTIAKKINFGKCIVTASPLGQFQDINCTP